MKQVSIGASNGVFPTEPSYEPHCKQLLSTEEWTRVPRKGEKCKFVPVSRSKAYELITPNKKNGFKPPVKSISLRRPGHTRGIRLINVQSLLAYARSFEVQQ